MKQYSANILQYGIILSIIGIFLRVQIVAVWGLSFIAISFYTFYSSGYAKASGNNPFNTFLRKSNFGEFYAFTQLEKLGFSSIITNVYVPSNNGGMTEIDIIAIHNTGIYVFEIKNYSGWIFGNEFQKNWTQSLNKKVKNQFLNPIHQNYGHIESLKTYLDLKEEDIFHSYIVFSIRSQLKKITKKSPEDVVCLTKQDLLQQVVKSHIQNRKVVLSQLEINNIVRQLIKMSNQPEAIKKSHIDDLKQKYGR